MKSLYYGSVLSLTLALSMGSPAKAAVEKIVDLTPTTIFVPVGFDDNDDVVAVVDGYLPDTCFRLRSPQVSYNPQKHQIVVQPRAVEYPGPCMDVTVPYTTPVHLGTIANGKYTVATRKGDVSENLTVKRATKKDPDDYLYAPVQSVQLEQLGSDQVRAILRGRFTTNCLRIDEVKMTNSGKTIEVLPIMKQLQKAETGEPCKKVETAFEEKVMLPQLNPGRYLVHTRSLNGRSVNEAITVLD